MGGANSHDTSSDTVGLTEDTDVRLASCFPYPPSEDQIDDVSCVSFAFSTATYCAARQRGLDLDTFPKTRALFDAALRDDGRGEGLTFASVGRVLSKTMGRGPDGSTLRMRTLRGSDVTHFLRQGLPVVAGYQCNSTIDDFHADPGFYANRLPSFRLDPLSTGSHAVMLVAWKADRDVFIARNSWGAVWGAEGHFGISGVDVRDSQAFTDLAVVFWD